MNRATTPNARVQSGRSEADSAEAGSPATASILTDCAIVGKRQTRLRLKTAAPEIGDVILVDDADSRGLWRIASVTRDVTGENVEILLIPDTSLV